MITVLLLLLQATLPLLQAPVLRREKAVPLEVKGRIDHMAADPGNGRVYVAALGNNTLEVVDTAAGSVVHSFGGLSEPQGVFYWPAKDRIFVANGGSGKVMSFDARSFAPAAAWDFNSDADNLRFDSKTAELYVGYGDGALGIINLQSGKRAGEITLDAHPESFQLETNGPRIFVNVPHAGHVAVVDRRSRTVIARWPLAYKDNFPMALDEEDQRLFVGCRNPARLVVLDTRTGTQIASVPVAGDTDDLFYDAVRRRIYVSGGEGSVSVIRQLTANRYLPAGAVTTSAGARTSLFVPPLRRLFVAAPHRGKVPAQLLVLAAE